MRQLDDRLRPRRLVTVVGPAGVGKTSSPGSVRSGAAPMLSLGVGHADLTRVQDEAGVPGALAALLGWNSFDALLSSPVRPASPPGR